MTPIMELLSGSWAWLLAIVSMILAFIGMYFSGKKIGTVQTQAKADVAVAVAKTEAIKASSQHESKVVKVANDAKQDSDSLSDDAMRDRMHDKWTKAD